MAIARHLLLSYRRDEWAIEIQNGDRRATDRSQSRHSHALPAEMRLPRVAPGMEQRNFVPGLWVTRRFTSALPQRARDAGQSEVLQISLSARSETARRKLAGTVIASSAPAAQPFGPQSEQ